MTLAAISDAGARAELWSSFAALLSGYATVEETATRKIALKVEHDSIVMRSGGSSMQLNVNLATGAGTSLFSPEGDKKVTERLELRLDGTMRIGDTDEALDLAAIDLLRRFVAALKRAEDANLAMLAVMVAVL